MKCPHCNVGIKIEIERADTYELKHASDTKRLGIEISHGFCSECNELIVIFKRGEYKFIEGEGELISIREESFLYPKFSQKIVDQLVPITYREAFNEANTVLAVNPKASAALSRRLLQSILRDEYNITDRDLIKQIEKFIVLPNIPSYVSEAVDAIRNIGNFAAHPNKYLNSAEIVEVEHGEADWLLDVLEALFDITFVQPKQTQGKKDKLIAKLAKLGKPPMKG